MRVLVLDNYDSFTYNLVAQIQQIGCDYAVHRNDKITIDRAAEYDKIIISPGPGVPEQAGVMKELISALAPTHSILGVCLGHQGIAEVFGARLALLDKVYHGLASVISIDERDYMFRDVPASTKVGRYHSWIVDPETLPGEIEVTARAEDGTIMALRHRDYDVRGLQFHPESVLSDDGFVMVKNFLLNSVK